MSSRTRQPRRTSKDVGHYKEDDGKAFVQTSKYLQRMVESMNFMLTKLDMLDLLGSVHRGRDKQTSDVA